MKKIKCLSCGEVFVSNWGRKDLVDHERTHPFKDWKGFEEI